MLDRLAGRVIPSNVKILKTRDYGATADEKADELLKHLYSATIAVILLMWITLSWREATVVAVVIPVTLALTLAASYFFGYTLNPGQPLRACLLDRYSRRRRHRGGGKHPPAHQAEMGGRKTDDDFRRR